MSAADTDTLFVWLNKTQTTPTAAQVMASGVSLPGTTTNYTFIGLDSDAAYYGWAVATRQSYESAVMASTPAALQTASTWIPVPTIPSDFAISQISMASGSLEPSTPHDGIYNLPSFLVGVPITRSINNPVFSCSFDRGGIHAYGFRNTGYAQGEPDTESIYIGNKFVAPVGVPINQVVYKYFSSADFTINTFSYMWFFTRTPKSIGQAEIEFRYPIPTVSSAFAISTQTMATSSLEPGTPFDGIQDLPRFLVGVPVTKGINNEAYSCSFDEGGIHAYGFKNAGWTNGELGNTIVYFGTKYDAEGGALIDTVVYKYFPDAAFTISTFSYTWFFIRRPWELGEALLNA
jgi:hypothetical protein